jgi:hypothetical protein
VSEEMKDLVEYVNPECLDFIIVNDGLLATKKVV